MALPDLCFAVAVDKHTHVISQLLLASLHPVCYYSWSQTFHAGWMANELSLDCCQAKRSISARRVGTARALSPGLVRPEREVDHSSPSIADVKNKWS